MIVVVPFKFFKGEPNRLGAVNVNEFIGTSEIFALDEFRNGLRCVASLFEQRGKNPCCSEESFVGSVPAFFIFVVFGLKGFDGELYQVVLVGVFENFPSTVVIRAPCKPLNQIADKVVFVGVFENFLSSVVVRAPCEPLNQIVFWSIGILF